MSYWDGIDNNSFDIEDSSSSYYSNSLLESNSNYFLDKQIELLDESLQEDRLSILNEDGIGDFIANAGSWFVGLPGSIWNGLKGLITGTNERGGAIKSSTIGNLADTALNTAKDGKAVINGTTFDTTKMSKGLAGYIKSWFGGGDPNGKGFINGVKVQADNLANFMRNHSDITTGALAGAGLLGIYYLYKKWKNNKNKKVDPQTLRTAVQLDQQDPSKMSPQERNQRVVA